MTKEQLFCGGNDELRFERKMTRSEREMKGSDIETTESERSEIKATKSENANTFI